MKTKGSQFKIQFHFHSRTRSYLKVGEIRSKAATTEQKWFISLKIHKMDQHFEQSTAHSSAKRVEEQTESLHTFRSLGIQKIDQHLEQLTADSSAKRVEEQTESLHTFTNHIQNFRNENRNSVSFVFLFVYETFGIFNLAYAGQTSNN
jgi:pyocin large subunit-like protein